MIRLTRTRKIRVSNRLATLAAFLLVAATVAGVSAPADSEGVSDNQMLASSQQAESRSVDGELTSISRNKGFKISLYLFRRN